MSFSATEFDPEASGALQALGVSGAKIGWVRMGFYFANIAPTATQRVFSGYDSLVANARAQGFQIDGLLVYGATWNTSAPSSVTGGQRLMYPPADYVSYAAYVTQLVSRYRNDVHTWEVWNEPDLSSFWGGTPADYAHLLSVAHDAIKAADPSALVLFAGLSMGGPTTVLDSNFLDEVLADPTHPAANNFDIANFHAYGPTTQATRRANYVKSELNKFGIGSRPIWVTETGYASDPALQNQPGYQNGPASQAQWLHDTLPFLVQQGVAKVFWFTLFDTPKAGAPFVSHGLLSSTDAPKSAVTAYEQAISAP